MKKKRKKKYKYIGIRNYPIRIDGKIVRPGDIVEMTDADFSEISNTWDFESMDTTKTEITFEMEKGKIKKEGDIND